MADDDDDGDENDDACVGATLDDREHVLEQACRHGWYEYIDASQRVSDAIGRPRLTRDGLMMLVSRDARAYPEPEYESGDSELDEEALFFKHTGTWNDYPNFEEDYPTSVEAFLSHWPRASAAAKAAVKEALAECRREIEIVRVPEYKKKMQACEALLAARVREDEASASANEKAPTPTRRDDETSC